jgi:hypothetical protein
MQSTSMNELISTTSSRAYNAGIEAERQRVIKILKSLPPQFSNNDYVLRAVAKALSEVKQ